MTGSGLHQSLDSLLQEWKMVSLNPPPDVLLFLDAILTSAFSLIQQLSGKTEEREAKSSTLLF